MDSTCAMRRKTQQANPIAIIRSLPKVTPPRESNGSLMSTLLTIIKTHVVNPKRALIPTVVPHKINATARHRTEKTEEVVQSPSNNTPTMRTTAALIRENNSINNVNEPIARSTRQKIVGTRDIYHQNHSILREAGINVQLIIFRGQQHSI